MIKKIKNILLALVLCFTSAANANKCLLEVNGVKYIEGPCEFSNGKGGSFEMSNYVYIPAAGDEDRSMGEKLGVRFGYFAQVDVDEKIKNVAEGYWNEESGVSHAQSHLGELHRNGACWVNAVTKVCAWK